MPIVPPGGLILLTGANGHVGSVTAKTLLDRGYKVRGTVRSIAKHEPLLSYFGPNFTLAEVPDFSSPGAFDAAIKGVDGVIHMAADVSFTHDPIVIEQSIQGIKNVMEAASSEPSVKRVALTSAKAACINEMPGEKYHITTDTWNDAVLEEIKDEAAAQTPQRFAMLIYGAAKLRAERFGFDYVREHQPHFVFNSVVPNVNIGHTVAIHHLGYPSGASLINTLDKGYPVGPALIPEQWYVNTTDTALLHLATLTIEDVKNERIMAMAGPYSWKKIVEVMNTKFPGREKMLKGLDTELAADIGQVDNERATELLKLMGRKGGFKSLEESVVEAMEDIVKADELAEVPRTKADDVIDMLFGGGTKA